MSYVGDIRLGDTIDIKFVTTAAATGAPTTLSGVPVISAYVGNSTTEITAGITLSVDFDSRTGLNNVRVVATSGNGYATASNYQLVITTGTVGGTSAVGYVVAEFSIENRSALMPTTAGRTLVVDAAGLADANTVKLGPSGSGTAQTAGDVGVKTGFALTAAYDPAKTAAQAGDAMALTAGERTSTADAFLNRDMSVGTDSGSPTVRTMRQALRFLRNKWSISGTTLTVTKEDDTTASWTSTVTGTPGADPITGNDPA